MTSEALQVEIVKAIPGTLTAAGVIVVGILTYRNGRKTDGVHDALNSRLTEWKLQVEKMVLAANAQGRQDERDSRKG
jgi:hypothetical protein